MVGFRLAEVLRLILTSSSVASFRAMTIVRVFRAVRAFVAAALILFSTPQLFASTPVSPAVPGSVDLQVADASGGAITDAVVLVQRGRQNVAWIAILRVVF